MNHYTTNQFAAKAGSERLDEMSAVNKIPKAYKGK
jgi:hypothetical protein